jgi:CheY-like chemotaxis protein
LNVVGVVRDTFVDAALHQSLRDRLERDGSYANVGFQLRTRDHRIITVRENARVVRDENGGVLYYEGTLTDVTERIRVENQLRESQKMDALGRLADGIARDFRGIGDGMMTRLKQALEVLPDDSPARPLLDTVAKSMHSAETLTRQILDFSHTARRRGTHGESGPAFDLNALIVDMRPELCRLMSPETCLELSLCEDPTPVLADPGHVRQVVVSSLIQACGFGAGSTRVSIATSIDPTTIDLTKVDPTKVDLHSPATVSLSVRSTVRAGSVRPNEDIPHIRPWVGMATSQAILAQYGGTITAAIQLPSSESGAVVRYSLCLPLAAGARPAPPAMDAASAATILLVEEDPLIRELGRDMLERQGFHVLTAVNTAEAERIGSGPQTVDVLITDSTPDAGQSAALVHCLRETRPKLRVLYIAGYSDGSADSIPVPSRSAILSKPFSGDSLGRKIRQLLDQSPPVGT